MNLSYIRYFVELAHVQHYTNAARNLNITQPSLSHAISQLEEELGVMLFEKNGRNTELTAFGREFLACAERSLGTLDAGVESIQKEAAGDGVIRLGLIRPLGMEFVPRLAAEYLKTGMCRLHFIQGPQGNCLMILRLENMTWFSVQDRLRRWDFPPFLSADRILLS